MNAAAAARLIDEEAVAASNRWRTAAVWWNHCAVKLSYPPSMDHLATCYLTGRGVAADEHAAVSWLKKSCNAGYVPAMLHIAECCENGVGGLKKSHYNANWWKTRARAAEGDRLASVWISCHKLEGWE
jgi:TPR repeat protein